MERLCTLNTATLSTRTYLTPKPAHKNRESRLEVIQGHAFNFRSTEKPTRNCVLRFNNVGFRVGHSKERSNISVLDNPTVIWRPSLGNPREYSHKPYTFRNYIHSLSLSSLNVYVCLHTFLWWALKVECCE